MLSNLLVVSRLFSPIMKHLYRKEEDLLRDCLQQKQDAQFELFERYKLAMFNLVYRICNDYDQANDILQEGFIDVFRNLGKFEQKSTLGAWIKSIMLRKALRVVSKKMVFEEIVENLEDQTYPLEQWIQAEVLDQAIRSLPVASRTVFVMYEVEGYSHQEIADTLHISLGTSKSQLHYAKKILQERLSKHYQEK
jgi:RNA polymerase sigma factor (sigma-70 family)